jgi:chemotaxis signal transduction protein
MIRARESDQWTIVRLAERLFAFPSMSGVEMLAMPEIRTLPRTPDRIRGLINLRGRVLPLVDLRSRLGITTAQAEMTALLQMMQDRQQDHRRWVAALEASVRENREFTLTTDPHKCAFGRWYDSYTSRNLMLAAVLRKFDEPHCRIHRSGATAVEYLAKGQREAAHDVVKGLQAKELPTMIRLFEELDLAIRDSYRETALVLADSGHTCAVSVDSIESVEPLKQKTFEPLPGIAADATEGLIGGVARRVRNDGMVIVLDSERLLQESAALV